MDFLNREARRSGWKVFALLMLMLLFAILTRYTSLGELLDRESLKRTFDTISASPWAPLAFVGSFSIALGVGVPASLFVLVGGVVFGVWPGTLYNWLGTLFGASIAFLVARYLGREFTQRLLSDRLSRIDQAVAESGFWAIFLMRLIPIVPFSLSNFAAGLTRIRFWPYFLATGVATLPGLTIVTYFAHSLWVGTGEHRTWRHLILASVLMLALGAVPWWYQRRQARRTSTTASGS